MGGKQGLNNAALDEMIMSGRQPASCESGTDALILTTPQPSVHHPQHLAEFKLEIVTLVFQQAWVNETRLEHQRSP
jgi:hypothetical protein